MGKWLLLLFLGIGASTMHVYCQVLNIGIELNFYAPQYTFSTPRHIYPSFNNNLELTVEKFTNPQKPFTFPGLAIQYDFQNNWFVKYSLSYVVMQNSSQLDIGYLYKADSMVTDSYHFNTNFHFIDNGLCVGYKFLRKRKVHIVVTGGINVFSKIFSQLNNLNIDIGATNHQVALGNLNDPYNPGYYLNRTIEGYPTVSLLGNVGVGISYRSFYFSVNALTNISKIDKYADNYYQRTLMVNCNLRYNLVGLNIYKKKRNPYSTKKTIFIGI